MGIVQVAKDVKHMLHVARVRAPELRPIARDVVWRSMDRVRPYSYRDGEYPDSFTASTPKVHEHAAVELRPQVFVVWAGDNDLTPNRAAGLDEIRASLVGTSLHLITPDTLEPWVAPDAPLHPAYVHLSLNHRSDYLRAYLMHHHGGAYLDIKHGYGDIRGAMARLAKSDTAWVSGYRELGGDYVSDEPGTIRPALRRHHGLVLGTPAFAARPGTPFTHEWTTEINRRMDGWAADLERNPGNTFGSNEGYPVPWVAIQGSVFQPLCLKYSERVMRDDRFKPSFVDYR